MRSPDNLFSLIRRNSPDEKEKKDLIVGYECGVLPISIEKAITRDQICDRIKKRMSKRTKESQNTIMNEIINDDRERNLEELTNKKEFVRIEKELDALLNPLGFKMELIPYSH